MNNHEWSAETDPFFDKLILNHFADYTDDTPPSPVVLSVGGRTIMGTMTPFTALLKRLGATLEPEEIGGQDVSDIDHAPDTDTRFLTLGDVTVHEGVRAFKLPFLRVRRDRIDAWTFGAVVSEEIVASPGA